MFQDRLAQLKSYLEDDPNDAFLLFAFAQELTKRDRADEARIWYYKLRDKHPEYVGLYYHLGLLEQGLGSLDLARNTYHEGIAVAQKIGDTHALNELKGVLALLEGGIG